MKTDFSMEKHTHFCSLSNVFRCFLALYLNIIQKCIIFYEFPCKFAQPFLIYIHISPRMSLYGEMTREFMLNCRECLLSFGKQSKYV